MSLSYIHTYFYKDIFSEISTLIILIHGNKKSIFTFTYMKKYLRTEIHKPIMIIYYHV